MKDSCGFEISEGLYEDCLGFLYYHIKETPEGFIKKGAGEDSYSLLDPLLASNIRRINRQRELVNLILSVENEFDRELEEEVHAGVFGNLGKVPIAQSQPK